MDGRAFAKPFAVDADLTAVRCHHPTCDGETKAGALRGLFAGAGGIDRIESVKHPLEIFFRNPEPCVLNGNDSEVTLLC